ncbi:MAG: TGS domain-containing protein [Pirellulaceae bacterium]
MSATNEQAAVVVRLPDGSTKEFDSATTVLDVAKSIGSRLAKDAAWGEIDGQPVALDYQLPAGQEVPLKIITLKSADALATMRHSCRSRDGSCRDANQKGRSVGVWSDHRWRVLLRL